ncbi:hypothetical protein HY570_03525 [Candidatus Micrarchaeota archaeon]|nr:hypothetical protein [Candidatus Micrarchaeota archaeon]
MIGTGRIFTFAKTTIVTVAMALLAYGLLFQGLETLVKLLAIAFGISLLTLLLPQIRGIRKGDNLAVIPENQEGIFSFLNTRTGMALQSGRKGSRIKVVLGNGMETEGLVVEYEGLISAAKVKLISKEYNISVA